MYNLQQPELLSVSWSTPFVRCLRVHVGLNNFLIAAKIEKNFKQNLYAIFTDPCWGALCILNNLFNGDRFTASQVSVFELLIFAHQNKGMYPPSGAGPVSKKKFIIFVLDNPCKLQNIREFSECSQHWLEHLVGSSRKIVFPVLPPFPYDFCESSQNSQPVEGNMTLLF